MSIRNFDFFEVFMKKIWISLISALYCGFTLGYMHFADPRTNAGALSTIGLDHPVLFALWGAGTYGVISKSAEGCATVCCCLPVWECR